MAMRDYVKLAPFIIVTIIIVLIVFVIISGISPTFNYPGKSIIEGIRDGIYAIKDFTGTT